MVNGYGVLLADNRNGPFKFEIQYIRAVHDFDITEYAPNMVTAALEKAAMERKLIANEAAAIQNETKQAAEEFYAKQRETAKLKF